MLWLLTFSYVALAALLLNATISTRLPRFAKVAAIMLVTACYGFAYAGYRSLQGWPAHEPLPDDFRMHWITVDEPNKETGEDGVIYFWIRHLDEYREPIGEPRSYRVPWSEALADQVEDVLEKIAGGELLDGSMTREVIDPEQTPEDVPRPASVPGSLGDDAMYVIEFRDVPKPTLPPKA